MSIANYPPVSVVITTWNRRKELELTLDEVMKQDYPNFEVIIVDNHSSDGTVEMVKNQFPSVCLIEMPTPTFGPCESMNIGFSKARGKYFVVLDDDSTPARSNALNQIVNIFETTPGLGIIAGKILDKNGNKWGGWTLPQIEKEVDWFTFIGCGAAFRAELLKQLIGYDKLYFTYENELDFALRALLAGYKIRYVPSLVFHHRLLPKRYIASRGRFYNIRNSLIFVWSHFTSLARFDLSLGILLYGLKATLSSRQFHIYPAAIFDALKMLKKTRNRQKIVSKEIHSAIRPYFNSFSFSSIIKKSLKKLRCHGS